MIARFNSQGSMDSIDDVLGAVRNKGVKLWADDGQLRYKAPKGALTREELETIRASRDQVLSLLERAAGVETERPTLETRRRIDRAPLAFSQLAHWHLYKLSERRAIRQIASATRLRGRLRLDALRRSLGEIVRRHDALRTRIVVCNGIPAQEIAESVDCELTVCDLTALPESSHEIEVNRLIQQFILEPVDLAVDPLFGLWLLKLRDDEHVLVVAMEHSISDMFSLQILLREVFAAYTQILKDPALSLPAVPLQFPEYALQQRNAQRSWIERHGGYWAERLTGCQRLRFPEDEHLNTPTRSGRGVVCLKIGPDLKAELREWSRQRRTTVVMSVFTAYFGLVLRWCNTSEAVIQYQSDGRANATMENTIGYFASVLFLRVAINEDDSSVDLMNRVTESYCEAYEHADFSYLVARESLPEFARNSGFNWIPRVAKTGITELSGSELGVTCCPVRFEHPMMKSLEIDAEPSILLSDTDDEIIGEVWFPLNRFSAETMERFGRNFLVFIEALLRQPDATVKGIALCN